MLNNRMIDEQRMKDIEQIAQMYAESLILYGVDITNKLETATEMSLALKNAYLRGRADGLKYAYESFKDKNKWILCSERLPQKDKASEYYESVIVTLDDGRVAEGCYTGIEWWVDAPDGEHYSEDMTGHVIAWMPLPEPYSLNNEANEERPYDHVWDMYYDEFEDA